MRFKLLSTKDDSDVLGGAVSEDNPYIRTYSEPVNPGDKAPLALDVGESVLRRYRLSGSVGVYRVVRIEDES